MSDSYSQTFKFSAFMTLNEYQQHALETAIYPENRRIIYPCLLYTSDAADEL